MSQGGQANLHTGVIDYLRSQIGLIGETITAGLVPTYMINEMRDSRHQKAEVELIRKKVDPA